MAEKIPYKIFPQTSDLGVEVSGNTLPELFVNAGLALMDIVTDINKVAEHESKILEIRSESRELLFREWLSELLYQFYVQERVFRSFRVMTLTGTFLKIIGMGEKIDYRRHLIKRELKSITYYQLEVSERDGRWIGRFVSDI